MSFVARYTEERSRAFNLGIDDFTRHFRSTLYRCRGFSSAGGHVFGLSQARCLPRLAGPGVGTAAQASIYISTCAGDTLMTDVKTKAGFRWSDLSVYAPSIR